ncbi:MAG: orotidine-5'-phosphate decarboxylase [Candidatus Methylopumilus sp.]|nr:orotidine-5'-phosphate decarboxylase [Candidatus Methylopumilus sp.]
MIEKETNKVIVALDYANIKNAKDFVSKLNPKYCHVKIGKELFIATGPAFIEYLHTKQFKVFLDLKFYDIPTTVRKACEVASQLGIWMLNVHASGGGAMLEAALEGVNKVKEKPLLIAVTVLTSMNQETLNEIGVSRHLEDQELHLAKLTEKSGLNGIVCSAKDLSFLKTHFHNSFLFITPGIRMANDLPNDQIRTMTPIDAIKAGSNYLVIGRSITQSKNPTETLEKIYLEIN